MSQNSEKIRLILIRINGFYKRGKKMKNYEN